MRPPTLRPARQGGDWVRHNSAGWRIAEQESCRVEINIKSHTFVFVFVFVIVFGDQLWVVSHTMQRSKMRVWDWWLPSSVSWYLRNDDTTTQELRKLPVTSYLESQIKFRLSCLSHFWALFGHFSYSTSINDSPTIALNYLLNWITRVYLELNDSLNRILGKQYWIVYWIESFFGKIQTLNWIR